MATADEFWAGESTPRDRRLFLDEAAGRDSGRVTFDFNVFAVTLDFDDRTVTVESVLDEGVSEVVGLETSSTVRLPSAMTRRLATAQPRCSVDLLASASPRLA